MGRTIFSVLSLVIVIAMSMVSVIMPVYNGERFLREAIESILRQTFSDYEFIIIDDGSRDTSISIVKEYDDKRIKLLENTVNLGITKTLNFGIKEATGSYICRMDSDDVSLQERLRMQVDYLEQNKEVVVVGTQTVVIDGAGAKKYQEYYPITYPHIQKSIFVHNPFAHSSVMIRRSVLDEVGMYNPAFLHNEDYDLWLRIASKYPVANLHETLLYRRVHEKNITVEQELTLTKYRIKTLSNAISSYYKNPLYTFYLLRPLLAYFWRLMNKVVSVK